MSVLVTKDRGLLSCQNNMIAGVPECQLPQVVWPGVVFTGSRGTGQERNPKVKWLTYGLLESMPTLPARVTLLPWNESKFLWKEKYLMLLPWAVFREENVSMFTI